MIGVEVKLQVAKKLMGNKVLVIKGAFILSVQVELSLAKLIHIELKVQSDKISPSKKLLSHLFPSSTQPRTLSARHTTYSIGPREALAAIRGEALNTRPSTMPPNSPIWWPGTISGWLKYAVKMFLYLVEIFIQELLCNLCKGKTV